MKEEATEGRKEGRKQARKEARKHGRKGGRKQGRMDGRRLRAEVPVDAKHSCSTSVSVEIAAKYKQQETLQSAPSTALALTILEVSQQTSWASLGLHPQQGASQQGKTRRKAAPP